MSGGAGNPITISLHICGITTDGKLWHASRPRNDSSPVPSWGPWSSWEEVKAQGATEAGPFVSAGCVVNWTGDETVEEFYVLGVTQDGQLLHTSRLEGQNWQPFENLKTRIGGDWSQFQVQDVTVGHFFSDEVCIIVLTQSGERRILRTNHYSNGTWDSFQDLTAPELAGFPGSFLSVGCAVVEWSFLSLESHICGITQDGRMWHTVNSTFDGSWVPFADVQTASLDGPDHFTNVKIAQGDSDREGESDVLHILAQAAGDLWHTVRFTNPPGWQIIFERVKEQAGDPGSFGSISCANVGGQLHLCGVTQDGKLWHTIRIDSSFPRGWEQFEDVTVAGGTPPGAFRFVSLAVNLVPIHPGGQPDVCSRIAHNILTDSQQISMLQQRNPNDPRIAGLQKQLAGLQQSARQHNC